MKALRLQDISASPSRKLEINSGASGIRKSKFLKKINYDSFNFYKAIKEELI